MKNFYCPACDTRVFFNNTVCLNCDASLGFDLESVEMVDLREPPEQTGFKPCQNNLQHANCNWAVPAASPDAFCCSCQLTEIIPDLSWPENLLAWSKIEEAKRRLVYNLDRLGLRPTPQSDASPQGLRFRFLAADVAPQSEPVLTGHAAGIITLNIAEANDAERERRRNALGEPYRTLVGHLRHEVGHYYWDQLVRDTARDAFRQLFGDESTPYGDALKRHYQLGPPADWSTRHISSYAAAHPWEDWAETWAHYLHMMDSLGTAIWSKVRLDPPRANDPVFNYDAIDLDSFDSIITAWPALACLINSFNRSLGTPDAYPFVITDVVVQKLRFIHELIARRRFPSGAPKAATPASPRDSRE